jgi:hypothetical protein
MTTEAEKKDLQSRGQNRMILRIKNGTVSSFGDSKAMLEFMNWDLRLVNIPTAVSRAVSDSGPRKPLAIRHPDIPSSKKDPCTLTALNKPTEKRDFQASSVMLLTTLTFIRTVRFPREHQRREFLMHHACHTKVYLVANVSISLRC